MNKLTLLAVGLFSSITISAQVGIGTQTPNEHAVLDLSSNSKGLLLPRMTSSERTAMYLTASDAGMMVYQTSPPKGTYTWDGSLWVFSTPIDIGSATSTTLRWDNASSKWIGTPNLFNGGGSIGVNTGNNPNYQLQLNSIGLNTKLQLTSSTFGTQSGDGVLLGINNNTQSTAGWAYLVQQEDRPLWFGTNGVERVRIDSIGRVGINTTNPSATLDVNGSFKLGSSGTSLQSIMRMDFETDPPEIAAFAEWICNIPCPNTSSNAVVYVSPGDNMDHIMIGFSRVNVPGNIQVKFMNMSSIPINAGTVMLHIALIQ